MPRVLAPILLAFTSALFLTGCGKSFPSPPPGVDPSHIHFVKAKASIGQPAPDFRLNRADDKGEVILSSKRGRPVVLVFGSYT